MENTSTFLLVSMIRRKYTITNNVLDKAVNGKGSTRGSYVNGSRATWGRMTIVRGALSGAAVT